MKRRSFFSVLAAVAGSLVLISGLGFAWVWAHSPLNLLQGAVERHPTAAMFVPRQAPLMASLLVNPDRLVALRQVLARPSDRRETRAEFTQLRQSLLAAAGLDYDTAIKPWLGDELTVAITTLDIDRDQSNGQQPGYLLALKPRDVERAREFLQLFWQTQAIAGTDLQFEQYQGAQLISGLLPLRSPTTDLFTDAPPAPPQTRLATAVVGREFILFANSPKVLRDAINNVQASALGLISDRSYQRALASLTAGRVGLAFVNLPQFATWLGQPPHSALATYKNMAVSLELNRQGVVAETALMPAAEPATGDRLTAPIGALQYLSALSPVIAVGPDFAQLWAQLWPSRPGDSGLIAQLLQPSWQDWQQRWQLPLTANDFAGVKSDYALGLLPQPTMLDGVLVVNRAASPEATAAIARLDDIAHQQGLTAVTLTLNGQTVSAWTKLSARAAPDQTITDLALQAEVAAVHTSQGDYELFTHSVAAMKQVLQSTAPALVTQPDFKQAIAPLLTPNYGYLYVDWVKSEPTLKRRFPFLQVLELVGQPFFNHLRSLSLSSYGQQSGIERSGLFVRLN